MADKIYYYYISTDNRVVRRCKVNCKEIDACNNCVYSESSAGLNDTALYEYLAVTDAQMDEFERKISERSINA